MDAGVSLSMGGWELDASAGVRAADAIDRRLHDVFAGHSLESLTQDEGPIRTRVPDFRVHAISPGPRHRGRWTYVTTGCWSAVNHHGHGHEFILTTSEFTPRAVELLAITANFHAGPPDQRLGLGHTTNLGEAWLPGSACDYTLLSLPYPWLPDLDVEWEGGHAQLLWVLPITRQERDFKREHGLEALEQRFEAAGLDYTDPARASVV
jgi:hypothetical protein